jgi:hypothetical protein
MPPTRNNSGPRFRDGVALHGAVFADYSGDAIGARPRPADIGGFRNIQSGPLPVGIRGIIPGADALPAFVHPCITAVIGQARNPTNIGSSTDGTTQNDVLFSSPGLDTVYKAGLKIHPGAA